MRKRIIIFSIITLVIQTVFWSCMNYFVPVEEDEYRSVLSGYEGLRYDVARKQVSKDSAFLSAKDYERLMKQIDWMEDVEHGRVTAYLPEIENDIGYVHVSVPEDIAGAEGLSETRAVPLLVYQEGFREFFGVNNDYIHYIQAIMAVIGILLMYYQVRKERLAKQLLNALWLVGIVYLPELLWILAVYGLSGGGYPGVSVGSIGEFSLYGIMRIVIAFRFLGVFTLGNMMIFFNRLLVKRKYLPSVVMIVIQIVPVMIGLIFVLSGKFSYMICGLSDSLIMTNAIVFSYDYVTILFFVNVIILAVCKFCRIYIYTEEDVAKMKRHFSANFE
ncbi:MAG: hypothetical protein NC293_08260 [Roseburia sp.]|nr:hypothetical protein [Roseburia sp.]